MCKKKQYISVSPSDNENSNEIENHYTNILITNPYVIGGNTQNSQENLILSMPNDLLLKAIYLESMDFNIKIICLCDFFTSLYYSAINLFFGILVGIISLNGYFASVQHNRNGMFCYMLYQYFHVFLKFMSIFLYTFYTSNTIKTLEFNNSDKNSNISMNTSYVSGINVSGINVSGINPYNFIVEDQNIILPILYVLFCIQCYLCYYVRKYYNLLPTKEDIKLLGGFLI